MEEQINKKSILFVFSGMLLIFLFFYKGFLLSGDNYLEECNAYVASHYDKTSAKTGMKKPLATSGNIGAQPIGTFKKDIVVPRNLIYEVLQNLENLKLNIGAMQHSIKAKSNSIRDKLKEYNTTKSDNFMTNVNKLVEESEKENGENIELMIDSLSKEIVALRTMMKDTN